MQVVEQLKQLSDERFLVIYESLENQGYGPLDGEVAKLMKFRPHAIKKLPMSQRAKKARAFVERSSNAELAYELFGTYLLKHHKGLVTGFLDKTGVKHDEGMIEDLDNNKPEGDKVATALTELDAEFAPEDVTLYLSMCVEQWPQVKELESSWRDRL